MKTTSVVAMTVLSLTLTAGAHAQDKCGANKMKAVAKKAAAKSTCYAKALAKGTTDLLPSCFLKAEAKFSATFAKWDSSGLCLVTGDGPPIEAAIDAFVVAVF